VASSLIRCRKLTPASKAIISPASRTSSVSRITKPSGTIPTTPPSKTSAATPTCSIPATSSLSPTLAKKPFLSPPLTSIAGAQCILEIEGAYYNLTSEKTGLVRQRIPRTAKTGKLRVPSLDIEIPCQVGSLDPIDEDSGWRARLIHLGYHHGDLDAEEDDDQQRLRHAIEEFQCDFKLKVTGQLDAPTRANLKDAHGA